MVGMGRLSVWSGLIAGLLLISLGSQDAGAVVAGDGGMDELKIVTSGGSEAEISKAMREKNNPVLVVGSAPLRAKPELSKALKGLAKKKPVLREGDNLIVVRNRCEHHVGGIFRRPFLYVANE